MNIDEPEDDSGDPALAASGGVARLSLRASLAETAAPIASGCLLAVAFEPWGTAWVAWAALVPFAATMARREVHVESYFGAFLGGLLFYGRGFGYVLEAYTENSVARFGPFLTLGLVAITIGASFWPAALWCGRRLGVGRRVPLALGFPLVWVASEYVRRLFYYPLCGMECAWLGIGLTQADYPALIQVARLGGEMAVAALVCLVNACLCEGVRRVWRGGRPVAEVLRPLAIAAGSVALAWLYGACVEATRPVEQGPVVALVPGEMTLGELESDPDGFRRALESAAGGPQLASRGLSSPIGSPPPRPRIDLCVWPEGALPAQEIRIDPPGSQSEGLVGRLEGLARRLGFELIVGLNREHPDPVRTRYFNSVFRVTPREGLRGYYDKVCLLSYAESDDGDQLPAGVRRTLGLDRSKRRHFQRGDVMRSFPIVASATGREYRYSPCICSDGCHAWFFRAALRQNAAEGVDFFVQSSREAFCADLTCSRQTRAICRVRAVETGRAIVRSVTAGYTAIIDASGRLVAEVEHPRSGEPILVGAVPVSRGQTLYATFGEWLPIGCCALVGAGLLRRGACPSRSAPAAEPASKA